MAKNPVIYATDGASVEMYNVIFSDEFRKVQIKIDDWHGRGDLNTCEAFHLKPKEPSNRIEILSSKFITLVEVYYPYGQEIGPVGYYTYQYYEYVPHPLSRLCDNLLNVHESLELSKDIRTLLEWTPQSEEEKKFLKELLLCINFQKLDVNRINYLRKIQHSLASKKKSGIINNNNSINKVA
jgi:hypothetical protein